MTHNPSRKQLAVIILNWNGIDLLKKFLPDAIRNTTCERAELIVADNGSTDNSVDWMRANFPNLPLICFDTNLGFAEGYNRAIAMCSNYPYTILLNSDVLVKEGWWQPLLDFMQQHPDVGACQPKIKSFANPESFEYAGAAGGLLDKLWFPYCHGRLFDRLEADHGQYNTPTDIAWASGAALCVRTDLYLEIGGLDTRFFAHMEEIDLCVRIQAHGMRICYVPDSEVFHVGGASLPQGNPKKTYLNFRNNLLLIYKNSPRKKGTRRTVARRLVDSLAFLMFAAKGDIKSARALLKAHRDYERMKSFYDDALPECDVLPHLPGTSRSILLDRYLPGRK